LQTPNFLRAIWCSPPTCWRRIEYPRLRELWWSMKGEKSGRLGSFCRLCTLTTTTTTTVDSRMGASSSS
jgi:hypothetical protein